MNGKGNFNILVQLVIYNVEIFTES